MFWKVPCVYAQPIAGVVFWKIRYHISYINTVNTACLSMETSHSYRSSVTLFVHNSTSYVKNLESIDFCALSQECQFTALPTNIFKIHFINLQIHNN